MKKDKKIDPKKGSGINEAEHRELISTAKKLMAANAKWEKQTSYVLAPIERGYRMIPVEKYVRLTGDHFAAYLRPVGSNWTISPEKWEIVKDKFKVA